MALVKCTECGGGVSTNAKSCPKCGAPAPKKNQHYFRNALVAIVGVVLFVQVVTELSKKDGPKGASGRSASPASAQSTSQQKAEAAADKAEKKKRYAMDDVAVRGVLELKMAMKDPESFKLKSLVMEPDGTGCVEYRGKNSFGADLPGQAVVTKTGKVYTHESNANGFYSNWNKGCTPPGGEDITQTTLYILDAQR